ncbi:uncharacterized protein LOC132721041 [Ruditapes philippinarum]|uniref:uncharacterized protein LOC132721041 n=1 Tax=Ruditapes philippinarum TaxID=129788 RepID=UPI00295A7744|nr:uncharacterized protein LOC132721041 [Ruditapes philippinarum]
MNCMVCSVKKLPNEFPPYTIAEECEHAPVICLRCTISHVEKTNKCPYPGCNQDVKEDDSKLNFFRAMVNTMFKEYEEVPEEHIDTPKDSVNGYITIITLTGHSIYVAYDSSMTIIDLKSKIAAKEKYPFEKQKLLYQNTELKNYKGQKITTLSHFGIKANTALYLIIRLYTFPNELDEVVFYLSWEYHSKSKMERNRDFLDVSCFVYGSEEFQYLCDERMQSPKNWIKHSGHKMDEKMKKGHQTIEVSLKKIPSDAQNIFFSLSTFNSKDISAFKGPSIKLYKKGKPSQCLCERTFQTKKDSLQALLMCSVSRNDDGNWEVTELGKPCKGNVKEYDLIYETIEGILRTMAVKSDE